MRTVLICLLLAWPVVAIAAEYPSMTNAALQTLWALLIVGGLILALYALARKRLLGGKLGGNQIRVIEMRPLLPKASLALVEVRGREYLLAINGGNIQLLADLGSAESLPPADFSSILADNR